MRKYHLIIFRILKMVSVKWNEPAVLFQKSLFLPAKLSMRCSAHDAVGEMFCFRWENSMLKWQRRRCYMIRVLRKHARMLMLVKSKTQGDLLEGLDLLIEMMDRDPLDVLLLFISHSQGLAQKPTSVMWCYAIRRLHTLSKSFLSIKAVFVVRCYVELLV